MDWEFFILLLGCLYLLALIAFPVFLEKIPRIWRLAAYAGFCAGNVFVAWGFHSLQILGRNISSGLRASEFFKTLQTQLSSGNFTEGLLELPGVGFGIFLSLLAVTAIIAIAFSSAAGLTLWRLWRHPLRLNIEQTSDGLKWRGSALAAELTMPDGVFEQLVVWRTAPSVQEMRKTP